jgi:succinate dehydrogenase / fumarate reductase cytochrome b subunit
MRQTERRQNYLGAGGWVWAGRYQMERHLYVLHRVTGLGLLLFGIIHLIITTFFRYRGESVWESAISAVDNPGFKVGEYLVVAAFVFHALNGLRLILQEFGFGLGRPTPPIYPYKDALRKKRRLVIILIAIIAILAVVFLYDFAAGGG